MTRWLAAWRVVALLMALTIDATAQVATDAPPPVAGAAPAVVERINVQGASLVGNLEGNSASREVLVALPPSYAAAPTRRYPVVYALHGYSIAAEQWTREIHVPQTVTNAFALGAPEMIVVIPDAKTRHNGSIAIALDVGDEDGLRRDAARLHDTLDRYGIRHTFEVYPGNHTNKVAERFQQQVLPFFSRHLCAAASCD